MELKTARTIARLTQEELAAKAGIHKSEISRVETGKRSIEGMAYASVVRIARALNLAPEEAFPVADLPAADLVADAETAR